jgi:hypothetical protein
MNVQYVIRYVIAGMFLVLASVASATPPSQNALGTTFKLVSKGQTNTVEISLKPTTSFDTVSVEGASGVESLTPPCSFSSVVVGGSYVCRVNVTQKAGEASFTLNVVGIKTLDPAKPRLVEVSHFTIANADFVAPKSKQSKKPTPGLVLSPGKDTEN